MDIHYTYRIINLTNGRFYIGKHSTNSIDDGYMGSGKLLRFAIQKYGAQNFKKEIISFFDNEDECYASELQIILKYIDNPNCYNLSTGRGGPMTEIIKRKISAANKGKIRTAEARRNYSQAARNRECSDKWRKSLLSSPKPSKKTRMKMSIAQKALKKQLSEEHKNAIRDYALSGRNNMRGKIGAKHHASRRVAMIDIDSDRIVNEFESVSCAGRYLGTKNLYSISACCRGERITGYGYKWKYV